MYEKGVKYEEVRGKARGENDESLELCSNTDNEEAFWNHVCTVGSRRRISSRILLHFKNFKKTQLICFGSEGLSHFA
ncbi:hypothetical protein VIGAN_11159200 [Vigna angularis var. angularis]|uniref:Uncharacterized protein n=1 Tax=Vigna angularis var. angularis TaxID=157739 RepID=A0A0S3TAV5_PHAAN|nr:hypothetical protein VIGAN_11159200 [Vigna angularis var. angularis]